jgi:hypothetical protein
LKGVRFWQTVYTPVRGDPRFSPSSNGFKTCQDYPRTGAGFDATVI